MSCEIIKLKMSEASLIYVDGGNTFYLQKHIIQSAFWAGIQPFLDNGKKYQFNLNLDPDFNSDF